MAQENPYLQLVQDDLTGSMKSAMQVAADKNPDVEAKLHRLAKAANVPLEAARLDTVAVERRVEMEKIDYQSLAEKYPSTAQLLADPANAALAKDDVEKLSFLEDTLNFGANFGRSVGAGMVPKVNAGLWGVAQAGADVGATFTQPLVGRILPQNPFAVMSSQFAQFRKEQTAEANRWRGNQEGMGFTQKAALSGAESLGMNLMLTPASILSGSPAPMMVGMTSMAGGDAYGQARDKGVSVAGSLAYGSSQAMVEYATEKLPALYLMRDIGLKKSFGKVLANQMMTEIPGEQAATVLQDMNEWAVLNPEKPFSAYLAERPSAAAQTLIATMVATGGQVTIAKAADRLANGSREQRAVDMLTALKDGVIDSKTFERAPERVKDFIAKHTANGPMENIFIPAEQYQQYFQNMQIDPAIAAVEMGVANFEEALMTGGDLVIPLADFITSTAKTPHYDGLINDIRFVQGEMTAREADLYEKNHPEELRKLLADAQNQQLPNMQAQPAITQMSDDIAGQLVAGGMEQGTAANYAQTYAKVMGNLAERSGMDPLALHEQYGMQIVRPMADVLTNLGTSDIQIDPLLDMLRNAEIPSGLQINGPSLIEFVREVGGINDAGGEIRQMEVDANKAPFVKNVAQLTGRGIDEVTALANEAGYQVRDLLAAIEAEIAGNPTYSVNNINETLQGQARDLNNLAEYLQQIGVDLSTANNDDVRQAMAAAIGDIYNQRTPDLVLELDVPLNKLSYPVRYALRGEIKRLRADAWNNPEYQADPDKAEEKFTGRTLIDRITERLGDEAEASSYLAALGITGVQLADGEVSPINEAQMLYQSGISPESILTMLAEAETIEIQAPIMTEQEIDDEQNRFLSDAPAGTRYTRTTGLLKRVRRASDLATEDLAGSPETTRRVKGQLGPFTGYQIEGEADTDNRLLVVRIFGDEQLQQDLNAEPALTFTVATDGELTVNGPMPSGATFTEFQSRGWADLARGADGAIMPGWSALKDPLNPDAPMSVQQIMPLLADVHARVREWRGEDHVGLRWSRATGAMGGLPGSVSDSGTAVFFQKQSDDKRGYIQFGKDRKFKIALLENADLSTFLHETGHFYLEVLGDLAAAPTASQQIKDDYAAILKFMKIESRDQIGVEQHELFARANEAYLREGKAPSPELRAVFQKFKAWLTMIYKSIEALDVTLSDEVRGVFNRIYASDAEIEAAKDEMDLPAMFATAADAGMTDQEFAVYTRSVEAALDRSKDTLRTKLMRQFTREKLVWWNAELDKVRADVGAELDALPEYRAFDALTRGELPDGTPFKLDKQNLIEQFGRGYVKRIPRGYGDGRGAVFSSDGNGLHHDAAADLLGYGSGSELVEALVNMRPRKALIEAEAKKRMTERHGDMLVDGTIAEEAVAAMHNEERANILRTELLAIRKKQIEVAPFVKVEADKVRDQRRQATAATDTPPASAFRDAARGMIGQTAVRDIRPYPYLLAERKAAKAAFAAMAKGDFIEAATQKQRELLNHYLYREAANALETTDDIYAYARKFTKTRARQKFGKAGGPYLEQIDDLLEQYEFADVPKGNLVRRENLLQFIKDRMEDDEPVMIPDSVLLDAQQRNYKTLPFDQLLAVRDAIKNIEHMVNLKTRLLSVQAQRALEDVVAEGAASVEEFGTLQDAPIGTRTWLDSVKEIRDGYFAAHRKLSSMLREMDGWKDDGFMWNTFMQPINDAANRKAVLTEDATKKLAKLYDKLQKQGLANKAKGLGLLTKQHYPTLNRSLSKSDLLALALNYGNEGNRQRIRDGYNWTDQQVLAALNRLEAHEWDFVQGMWDLIDSYWSDVAAQDKRINGIEPAKVDRSGFILPSGRRVEGGYYPIKYDERHSVRSYQDRAKEEADRILRGAVARPGVDTGFTKDRAGKVIDRKIKLDLGVGLAHIDTVLQTLTHREMLIDINKILGATKMNGAILDHYGIETYKAIQEAIVDIAAGEIGAQDAFESGMAWLRSGVTIAGMGLNLTTALMQPLGITQSMVRIGPKWAARGIARFLGDALHMENATKFVYDRSDMMRLRSKTQTREIAEIRNKISKGGIMPKVEETYFYAIVKMQAVVDVPTWLGAYEKYMEQTGNDEPKAIALADQAVVDAQGGGQTKDLASIQRGGPLKKLFTTFYSYFSATWNLSVESAGRTDFKKIGDVGKFAVDMLLLYTIPVVLTAALKEVVKGGQGPDDDEEWYAWLIKEQLSFMTGTLVGLREISSAIQGMYGYSGPAGTRFFSEAGKLVKQAEQGELDAALAKSANNTAGILFHYPAGQVQRTIEGFLALKDGTTANPAALLFGPPKD